VSITKIRERNGRLRHRLEDNIIMDFREIGWGGGMYCVHLAEDGLKWLAVVNTVMNLLGSKMCGSC
jgi:hypothetical protein